MAITTLDGTLLEVGSLYQTRGKGLIKIKQLVPLTENTTCIYFGYDSNTHYEKETHGTFRNSGKLNSEEDVWDIMTAEKEIIKNFALAMRHQRKLSSTLQT